MSALLRENLPYKIAALIFAVLLHFYVVGQQAPARMLTVPLAIRNVPSNLILSGDVPSQVQLTLSGPADEVDSMTATDVVASLDLSHSHAGQSLSEHVLVKCPADVQADPSPEMVTLALLPRESRRLAVTAADPGAALPGYRFEAPVVSPHYVLVSGSQDAVDAVHQLVVKTDAPTNLGSVDGNFDIVALDSRGSRIPDVTITPPQAHVVIHMVAAPAVKEVPVVPDITGSLPPTVQVTGTDVQPRIALISGTASRLAEITSVGTAPVDISNAVTDVTRTVNCIVPPGVVLKGTSAASVTVHIGPPSSANPPPPNPAASAAPGTTH
jgi:YbbR domain-containing protein